MPLVSTMCFQNCLTALWRSKADHPFSSFHSYLSDEPAFVCKSCFSVSIIRTVSGDTHTIIEGSLPARRWSKTVGRRAKQYDFPKPAGSATNTSRPLTLFYSLLLLVFQALQAECLYCYVDSGIDLLFAVPGYVYLVWLARLPPEQFCTL